MKSLITGAAGQLGVDLQTVFAEQGEVVALARADLDVTDRAAVSEAVLAHRPDVVLHAGAYTKVDACETEPSTAWAVNTVGSWYLAQSCERLGAKMVYLSSDYVFDGLAGRPYCELDTVNPQSIYGRTKEGGEQKVRDTLGAHFIVRTSWVHGAAGANFAKTMLRLGRERGAVSVVDDQTGSPTFTPDLAAQIARLVETDLYGTYHVTNTGSCTWFEFAQTIFARAGVDVDLTPTDTESFGAPAPRPRFSVLENLMTDQIGLPAMPAWEDSLERFLQEIA